MIAYHLNKNTYDYINAYCYIMHVVKILHNNLYSINNKQGYNLICKKLLNFSQLLSSYYYYCVL